MTRCRIKKKIKTDKKPNKNKIVDNNYRFDIKRYLMTITI